MFSPFKAFRFVLLCLAGGVAASDVGAQPDIKLPAAPPALPPLLVKHLAGAGNFSADLEIATRRTNSTEKAETLRGRVVVHDGTVRFDLNSGGGWPGGRGNSSCRSSRHEEARLPLDFTASHAISSSRPLPISSQPLLFSSQAGGGFAAAA